MLYGIALEAEGPMAIYCSFKKCRLPAGLRCRYAHAVLRISAGFPRLGPHSTPPPPANRLDDAAEAYRAVSGADTP